MKRNIVGCICIARLRSKIEPSTGLSLLEMHRYEPLLH